MKMKTFKLAVLLGVVLINASAFAESKPVRAPTFPSHATVKTGFIHFTGKKYYLSEYPSLLSGQVQIQWQKGFDLRAVCPYSQSTRCPKQTVYYKTALRRRGETTLLDAYIGPDAATLQRRISAYTDR